MVITSFQAVSGAGVKGIEELRTQTTAWARGEEFEPHFFQHRIAFNVIPHIDEFVEGGYTVEEMKLVNEARKILELPELAVSPTMVRVPVFTAHSLAINAETELPVSAGCARQAFASFPGLAVLDDLAHSRCPMPLEAEGNDDCLVGRIREDLNHPNALSFWVVGDQLRKGAALNGIQIAETLIDPRP
ncbi:MAG TPA: aspartate-semialdehyde dehydrogenase [Candidatus Binataceae bacterium]|nr:aspartate-semialdehyde dehydrogenase [Candidatus Binataceae bacterium]